MIVTQISQKARPITAAFKAVANFGTPTVGVYDFANATNARIPLFVARQQCIYLIERLSWSGSIPGETWAASTDVTPPTVTLYYLQKGQEIPIDPYPYSLNGYTQDAQWSSWIMSDASERQIYAKISGDLQQVADTVAIAAIFANLQFSIYELTDTLTNRAFVEQLAPTAGQQMRGGM